MLCGNSLDERLGEMALIGNYRNSGNQLLLYLKGLFCRLKVLDKVSPGQFTCVSLTGEVRPARILLARKILKN